MFTKNNLQRPCNVRRTPSWSTAPDINKPFRIRLNAQVYVRAILSCVVEVQA